MAGACQSMLCWRHHVLIRCRGQTKRENEIAKIRANLEKDIIELEKTAERLQSIAGARFQTRYKPEGKQDTSLVI